MTNFTLSGAEPKTAPKLSESNGRGGEGGEGGEGGDGRRVKQQKEGSYLRPRQLVYKSSPERRRKHKAKDTIKDAATVNTCTVKTGEARVSQGKTVKQMQESLPEEDSGAERSGGD